MFGRNIFGRGVFGRDIFGRGVFGRDIFGRGVFGRDIFGRGVFGRDIFGLDGGGGGAAPGAVEADENGRAHVTEELRVEGGAEAAPAAGAAVVGPVRALGEVAGGRGEEEDAARDDD